MKGRQADFIRAQYGMALGKEETMADYDKLIGELGTLRDQLALVQKQNADNLKMRGEYMKERDVALLQLSEWRKCGEGLRADIQESLAQEGMGAGDTPESHYSAAYNRLLELLKEAK